MIRASRIDYLGHLSARQYARFDGQFQAGEWPECWRLSCFDTDEQTFLIRQPCGHDFLAVIRPSIKFDSNGVQRVGVFRWPVGRVSRTDFFVWLVGINLLVEAIDWWAFGRLNLKLNLGFRFEAIQHFAALPVWRVLLEVAINLALAALAIARLHDASYSARWLTIIMGLAVAAIFPFASGLAVVGLLARIGIFFLPPSIGPNLYGADPRGWKSREHFETLRKDLAEGKR